MNSIPFIPESAPFSPDQRAWLNGFFVGLFSSAHPEPNATNTSTPSTRPEPLLVLFGSQTGSAEGLAKRMAKESKAHNFVPEVRELNSISPSDLTSISRVILITSTWGDGEPPDNAVNFWKTLRAETAPRLENLTYSVLALGDRNYSDFCGAGRKFDERLHALGAKRLLPRVDCDVDYEADAKKWSAQVWKVLADSPPSATPPVALKISNDHELTQNGVPSHSIAGWSRSNPFSASVLANRLLNAPGSAKETRHFEICLEGSNLHYEPGDALGIYPENCPHLVTELIETAGWKPEERVIGPDGSELALVAALLRKCDLRKPSSSLLDALAKAPGCETFARFLEPENKASLVDYLAQREVIDLLLEFPHFRPSAPEFVQMLGKLQPRLYSISSSIRAFPAQVHLTVAIVRYDSCGRSRKGVCSSFLADRAYETDLPIFIQTQGFRLPPDPDTPIIMVGPGTGIAPFRAFLHERKATGATGKNWLFFGDQQEATDFLYREELNDFSRQGILTHLDTAFSRDQSQKVYVQDRMLENARELWLWLEMGAHFYVCGDAKRMARDVDAALHKIIELAGRSPDQAADYVQQLKAQKRYQRDVY